MRMSIGVPGLSIYFEHHQVKPFMQEQFKKAKDVFDQRVVPEVLQASCEVLEVIANNAADAHDYLIGKLPKRSA
jgi:hypothetical protein